MKRNFSQTTAQQAPWPCAASQAATGAGPQTASKTSQYLNLTKNSSLAVAIGYPELVSVANTSMNQTGQAIEAIAILMAVYLAISLVIAVVMNIYNSRVRLVER